MATIDEAQLEAVALDWFRDLGYAIAHGPDLAPGESKSERASFADVVLVGRLRAAIARLNPAVPADAQDEALRKVLYLEGSTGVACNRAFHTMLRNGVPVEYRRADGSIAGDRVALIDFVNVAANDWLALNQFTVKENKHDRRPDVVVFVNGLPLAVIELKNAADADATIWTALAQLQTYKAEIPSLLHYNAALVISDGVYARVGSLTANQEWFKVWRTIDGRNAVPKTALELDTLIHGVFERRRFLDLIQHFITFEEDADRGTLHKLMAGYHQFHAVHAAVEETVRASGMTPHSRLSDDHGTYRVQTMSDAKPGDRRAGVVWHTQGSGKSLTMLFYAARIVREPAMRNPTLVVLTDRNDLDDQLFGQFLRCADLLGQTPVQAASRERLRELLAVGSGGVVFTTIQKFLAPGAGTAGARMPCLSNRQNIVVIADEAHRSQYDLIDGLARHMRDALPQASFIGFTGTPIEKNDANTRAVFGDYISIYDIQRAVADEATKPIYYESRIAKLGLNAPALPAIDAEFEDITEGEETSRKEQLKTKWAALEALVGDPKRVALIATDLVAHIEKRWEALDGKAMIVCMSRRVCIDIHDAILRLRPDWASAPDDDIEEERKKTCVVKVVMTGGADDGPEWQQHIRNKERRKKLALRLKDPKDPFRIVIVRDMWLTGFDAPCLHTMYIDKPMQGHGLMQAIARVNRVFRDKPGGLVVDYLGLADQLKQALRTYTESGGSGQPTYDTDQAIALMREKHGVARDMLHGFDWSDWVHGTPAERLALIPAGQEHILAQEDGKARFVRVVSDLSKAFALCAASDEATEIRDDIAFFQALQAALSKQGGGDRSKTPEQLDAAVRQLVSKAITTDGQVIDVFTAAGLPKPDISILSEEFLAEVRGLKHKHVAAELLAKLLHSEIQTRGKRNVVLARQFSELLQKTLNAYHNRAIATQEVIEELIALAKQLSEANQRGVKLGLSEEEIAFYDALATNDSAKKVMGDTQLRVIATDLVTMVRKNVSIDWTLRESAQARMRVLVKRILNKFGYPPDLQDVAVQEVLAQAARLCADWATV
jgi:type I restriction enzyme R subunit